MAYYKSFSAPTGMALFATATRKGDGKLWNNSSTDFETAPSDANQKITMTEGTGTRLGIYTFSIASTNFSGDDIAIEIHDDNHPSDMVIACWMVDMVAAVEKVRADVAYWRGTQPNALSSGRVDVTVGAMQANVLTAAATAGDHVTAIQTAVCGIAASVWAVGTSNFTTGGTVGKLVLDNLNATVSSRGTSTLTAANVWDYLTSSATTSGSLGKRLADNLDATVSSRLAAGSYTSPPSASTIAAAVWDYLSAAATTANSIGKRIVDYLNAPVGSIPTSNPTAVEIADAVLSRSASNVEASAAVDSLCFVILANRQSNLPSAGSTWTVYQTDGVTVFDTLAIGRDGDGVVESIAG